MSPVPEPASAASVFAALGDPTRLGLVALLCDGRPRSVSELSQGAPITRQAVTKHLRVLDLSGVVGSLSGLAARPASRFAPIAWLPRAPTSIPSDGSGTTRWDGSSNSSRKRSGRPAAASVHWART